MTHRLRCAAYTRKSTEEGLDQDFNSLNAQREACEAYIKSQKNEGWSLSKGHYDDGGHSGGTLNRPALQNLLREIKLNRIDVIVVYKVDRLTRSLADFAKLVELFDQHGVSFVSVTQAFNTTTSMGRLTLNVLLSFAQFEREVTAERIRDKIAASKKKGMWMGGPVPLGYNVNDRKLLVNKTEAKQVRQIFELYLKLDNVRELKVALDRRGIRTKRQRYRTGKQVGGCAFTRGRLYHLLKNPLYIGKVRHKEETYEGQHEAIIKSHIWEAVQDKLDGRSHRRKVNSKAPNSSLLTGLLFDDTGERLTPSHAVKGTKRYRYYISASLSGKRPDGNTGWRLPAQEIETIVKDAVSSFLGDTLELMKALCLDQPTVDEIKSIESSAETLLSDKTKGLPITRIVRRVELSKEKIRLIIDVPALRREMGLTAQSSNHDVHEIIIPVQLKRRGVEAKLVIHNTNHRPSRKVPNLIRLLARSADWFEKLKLGEMCSLEEIARQEGMSASDVSRYMPLAFLAPDIVEAIIDGRQPIELTVQRLKFLSPLPMNWIEQRQLLGIGA